ncbi:hypothetical protein VTH82DRAFT_5503 [Thermothelomyces myriococcoides]
MTNGAEVGARLASGPVNSICFKPHVLDMELRLVISRQIVVDGILLGLGRLTQGQRNKDFALRRHHPSAPTHYRGKMRKVVVIRTGSRTSGVGHIDRGSWN